MCQHPTPSTVAAQRPFSKRKVSSEPKILCATALKLQFSHLQFSCWCLFPENLHLKIPTNHLHSVYPHKSSFNCLVSHASCQISIPGQSSDMSLLCPSFLLAFEILTQYGSFLPFCLYSILWFSVHVVHFFPLRTWTSVYKAVFYSPIDSDECILLSKPSLMVALPSGGFQCHFSPLTP